MSLIRIPFDKEDVLRWLYLGRDIGYIPFQKGLWTVHDRHTREFVGIKRLEIFSRAGVDMKSVILDNPLSRRSFGLLEIQNPIQIVNYSFTTSDLDGSVKNKEVYYYVPDLDEWGIGRINNH